MSTDLRADLRAILTDPKIQALVKNTTGRVVTKSGTTTVVIRDVGRLPVVHFDAWRCSGSDDRISNNPHRVTCKRCLAKLELLAEIDGLEGRTFQHKNGTVRRVHKATSYVAADGVVRAEVAYYQPNPGGYRCVAYASWRKWVKGARELTPAEQDALAQKSRRGICGGAE